MQIPEINNPMTVALVGTVAWAVVFVVLGLPFARAWAKRLEQKASKAIPSDMSARLERIEAAVEAIAIEVERISESQRFLTRIQSERLPLSASSAAPERQR